MSSAQSPQQPSHPSGTSADPAADAGNAAALTVLDEENRRIRQMFNILPVGLAYKDLNGRYKSVNSAWERILGRKAHEVIGRTARECLPAALAEVLEKEDAEFLAGDADHVRKDVPVHATSADQILMITRSRLYDAAGECEGQLLTVADITVRMRHVAELEVARSAALAAGEAKAAFLATMSHEIRTPMNGVIGMTQLLAQTPLNREQTDFVHTISTSSGVLLALINDILDFSKIESGHLALESEPLSLARVAEEALDMGAAPARAKGLELMCRIDDDVPPMVLGDVTRLRQVLTNLISNAVKFTAAGEVMVSGHLLEVETADRPARIEFRVRDTGIGLPPDRIASLFAAFTQVDASTTRKYGGTGLGLAISRRLVTLMGGSISAENAPGGGSLFRFDITVRSAPWAALPEPLVSTWNGEPRRILVVDDHPVNREILQRQLQLWGCIVETVSGGVEALARLATAPRFDAAILDYMMPEMDGVMLARVMRTRPELAALPLVLLSSGGGVGDAGQDRLFCVRLVKPAHQSALFDAVASALSQEAAPVVAGAAAAAAPLPVAALHLLVADDNSVNRKVAHILLTKLGYHPDMAESGKEAVAKVAQAIAQGRPYDAVLMDVQMPEIDGLEATRIIRASHGADLRIIAMTAHAMQGAREECLAAGMDDYVTKPVEIKALSAALARVPVPVPMPVPMRSGGETAAAPVSAALATAVLSAATSISPAPSPAPSPSAATTPSAIAVDRSLIDWSRLDALNQFDDEQHTVVHELLGMFRRETPLRCVALMQAAAAGDAAEAGRLAHSVKGSALNLGAVRLAEAAAEIEHAAIAGGAAGIAERAARLHTLALQSVRMLDAHFGLSEAGAAQ